MNFATFKDLTVKSTTFPYRNIHKYTWTSPEGITHNQIDHVLIDKRRQSSIIHVRSLRGAECDTDHHLVVVTIQDRLSLETGKKQNLVSVMYNLNKLRDDQIREKYQTILLSVLYDQHVYLDHLPWRKYSPNI